MGNWKQVLQWKAAGVGEAVTGATGTGRFGGGCHGDLDADEGSRGCEQPQCPAQKLGARQSSQFSLGSHSEDWVGE